MDAYIAVSDVKGTVSELGAATSQPGQTVSYVDQELHLYSQIRQKAVVQRRRKTNDAWHETRFNYDISE